MSEGQEQRLWQIDGGGDRNGVPLWPLAIILVIGAAVLGVISVPCNDLRFDYVANARDTSNMNWLLMSCTEEYRECVCRQKADSVQGGVDCEVRGDLIVRCRRPGAEESMRREVSGRAPAR